MREARLQVEDILWRRPEWNTFDDITGSLSEPECVVTPHPPRVESTIKKVIVEMPTIASGAELWEELADAATNNETVKLKLSVEGIPETVSVEARVLPDEESLIKDSGPFRAKVSVPDRERFVEAVDW